MTEHDQYLRYLTYRGIRARYPDPEEPQLAARVEYELRIIAEAGFASYLLIVADIVRFCRDHEIPVGPGRGSVCGSVVAYALQITDVDPIRFGIPFERFLHLDRVAQPDIDLDVCQTRRGEVIEYIRQRYRPENVAQIAAFGTLMARGVVREVCRILDVGGALGDRLADMIPEGSGADQVTLDEFIATPAGQLFLAEIEPLTKEHHGQISNVLDICRRLEGVKRSGSSHSAGVVIADRPLDGIVPLWRKNKDEGLQTQYDHRDAEEIGLLKMDVLGLRTMTVLGRAERLVQEHVSDFRIRTVSLTDISTFQLLTRGDTVGVFQLEGDGITAAVRGLRPDCFEDIIAMIALYRPGPMEQLQQYNDRKHGREPVTYALPEMEPVLARTYGLIVFQEQVMALAQVLADYTAGEADLFRKAIGKKLPELIQAEIARFAERAIVKGYSARLIAEIGAQIADFGRYGFNLGHATGYAFITYWTAYLKANWPAQFYAATLDSYVHEADRLGAVLLDARRHGITVRCPDINLSDRGFTLRDGTILFGLEAVKGLGENAVRGILDERDGHVKTRIDRETVDKVKPDGRAYRASRQIKVQITNIPKEYVGLWEFCHRLPGLPINFKEALVKAGTFASDLGDRAKQLAALRDLNDAARAGRVYNWKTWPVELAPVELEMIKAERQVLGFYVTKHPLSAHEAAIARYGAVVDGSYERLRVSCCVAGLITDVRTHMSKRGEMAWLDLESGIAGLPKITLFADVWSEIKEWALPGEVLVAWAKKEHSPKFGPSLIANRALVLDEARPEVQQVTVCIPDTDFTDLTCLARLTTTARKPVLNVVVEDSGRYAEIRTGRALPCNRAVLREVEGHGWSVRYDPAKSAVLPWVSGVSVRPANLDLAVLGRGCPIWSGPVVRAALQLLGGTVVAEREIAT